MKTYSKGQIISMNEMEFANHFKKNDKVLITLDDDSIVEGLIEEIELASNPNPQSHDHLPSTIKVTGKNIDVFLIKTIEV